MITELTLVLVYVCLLLLKSCDISPEACKTYGFGESPQGVYLFVVFTGLGLLLTIIMVASTRLWIEGSLNFLLSSRARAAHHSFDCPSCAGNVPTVLLMARAHSLPPSTIVQRVLTRRQETRFLFADRCDLCGILRSRDRD
eukprot:1057818-Prymnesium_polylepis.1